MSLKKRLARRAGFAVLTVVLVLTVMFLIVALVPDPPNSRAEVMMEAGEEPPTGSPRDADTSIVVRWFNWMVRYATLDWGTYNGEPVTDAILESLAVTSVYVVPAVVLAMVVGALVGYHAALKRDTAFDRVERILAYVLFAVPGFFIGEAVLLYYLESGTWVPWYDPELGLWTAYNFKRLAVPGAVLATGMMAVVSRHARAESLKYVSKDFVKLARAQGAGAVTIARHILPNAAVTVTTLFFAELIGVLFLSIIAIEEVFQLPGFGQLLMVAAHDRIPGLVIGVTVVATLIGIGGNFLGDVLALLIDPRVDDED